MRKTKKLTKTFISMIFCLIMVITMVPATASAASTKSMQIISQFPRTVNGATFSESGSNSRKSITITKGGKTAVIRGADWNYSVRPILTDGKTVYYVDGNYKTEKYTIYKYIISTGKKTKIYTAKGWGDLKLCGYYNKKIYFTRPIDPNCTFWYYDTAKKKAKKITGSATRAVQQGKYFFVTAEGGDSSQFPLRLYNASSGKITKIANRTRCQAYSSTRAYYIETYVPYISGPYKLSVKSCKFNGSGKKTHIKSLTVKNVQEFTTKYIKYTDKNGKTRVKKF